LHIAHRMAAITASLASDAREGGSARGHRLLASLLLNDNNSCPRPFPVDRLGHRAEALLAHLQRDLAVAGLALSRSQHMLDCLGKMCSQAQAAEDAETQPFYDAVDRLRAPTKSSFPDMMDHPVHSIALALSTCGYCEGSPGGQHAGGRFAMCLQLHLGSHSHPHSRPYTQVVVSVPSPR
jgi:hypothetical protein